MSVTSIKVEQPPLTPPVLHWEKAEEEEKRSHQQPSALLCLRAPYRRGPLGTHSCFLAAGTLRLSASVSVCSARGRDNDHDEPTHYGKPGPFTSLVNGPGILERQREEFTA
ncbi:hypothetical protein Anapl_13037 [Anas platyrhynchos]|uniref:Uncharacterized protein n=1 Tax=Anas platyrhynchos TaxID=8839 RepID=R0JY71_ANAPL|nr:hypothetical protein Anapl_13037 [Anas platyrhynchos]